MSNPNNSEYIRLKELGNSKYEVAENESDIRGWTVKNAHGRILGKVNDLLFDVESRKVLYMVMDLEGNEMHLRDRKVLVPLSIAEMHDSYQNVVLPGIMANELTEVPTYEKGKVSTRIEDLVQHAFAGTRRGDTTHVSEASAQRAGYSYERSEPHINHQSDALNSPSNLNQSKPQTVMGVFEHTNQGQMAVEYLLNHNFDRSQIEISSRGAEGRREDGRDDNDSGVTNWFKSVFVNDDDAKTYSDAARTGCVITIQTSSIEEAERAADILDKHGALNLNGGVGEDKRFRSRIFDTEHAKWKG